MQSVYRQKVLLFTLLRSSLGIVKMSWHAFITHQTPIFSVMKRDFMNKSWIFCTPILAVLRIHLSTWKNHASSEKKTNCGSASPSCTDRRNQLQKYILATGWCCFKSWLLLSYMVAAVTILWPFVHTFLKHSSPELMYFLWHFPADSYLKYSCTKHRCCSTVYLSQGTLLHHWRTDKCIYQHKANAS
jgi:hypothetical protein